MKIYKVTNAQLKTLLEKGSITVGGTTYNYNSEDVYVVTDGFPEYRMSVDDSRSDIINLTKDGTVVATATIDDVAFAKKSNTSQSLQNPSDINQYETVNSIREKTVAPLITADTVLTADLAKNIVAVGYFETGTATNNERWYVMIDQTTATDGGLEAFRWESFDMASTYAVSWNKGTKWSTAEVINSSLALSSAVSDLTTKVNNKLDKVTSQGNYRVYAISGAGSQGTIDYSPGSTGSTIMSRDAQGKAQVATPTDSDNKLTIATKEYVDNHSSGLTLTDNEDGTVTLNIV